MIDGLVETYDVYSLLLKVSSNIGVKLPTGLL